jgi:hypothetical protein
MLLPARHRPQTVAAVKINRIINGMRQTASARLDMPPASGMTSLNPRPSLGLYLLAQDARTLLSGVHFH